MCATTGFFAPAALTIAQMLSSRLVRRLQAEDTVAKAEAAAGEESLPRDVALLRSAVLAPRLARRRLAGQDVPTRPSAASIGWVLLGLAVAAVVVAWWARDERPSGTTE